MSYGRLSQAFAVGVCLAATSGILAAANMQNQGNEPNLTEEQKKDFLLHAKVVSSKQARQRDLTPMATDAAQWRTDPRRSLSTR